MNTEKKLLSEDLVKMHESVDDLFKKTSEEKQLALAPHESEILTTEESNFLKGIGFFTTENVKEFEENKQHLESLGFTLEVINSLKRIKDKYNKPIISYNNVCDLCKKYNLYFGPSSLFTGKIPKENIQELKDFDFSTFCSQNMVPESREGMSILNSIYTSNKTMIVAPLNLFVLKNVFISNSREIIKLEDHSVSAPKNCPSDDPIVLLPFKPIRNSDLLFFIVVTHWDNSKSII